MGRNRKSIPPLLTLDHHYIWFHILTYIIFFLVPALIILISKHLDIKENQIQKRIYQGEKVFDFGWIRINY